MSACYLCGRSDCGHELALRRARARRAAEELGLVNERLRADLWAEAEERRQGKREDQVAFSAGVVAWLALLAVAGIAVGAVLATVEHWMR